MKFKEKLFLYNFILDSFGGYSLLVTNYLTIKLLMTNCLLYVYLGSAYILIKVRFDLREVAYL